MRNRLVVAQVDRATSSGDWQTAKLVLLRLSKADPANASYRFQLAQMHLAAQETERAIRIVRDLVFADEGVQTKQWDANAATVEGDAESRSTVTNVFRFRGTDPRFLLWMIENVYDQTPWEELAAADQDDCLAMFATLNSIAPDDQAIAQRYAERLIESGRYQDALPVLVSLIPTAPGIGLRAAIIAKNLGFDDKAAGYAQESRDRFAALVQQNPESAELAVALARCQVFLDQHLDAIGTIDTAIAKSPDDQMKLTLLGIRVEAIIAWADATQSQALVPLVDRLRLLQLLEESLRHAPNHPQLLQMVITHVLDLKDEKDQGISDARQALVNGVSPGLAHFIHGTVATIEGRKEQARTHLQLAANAFPDSDVILNNLAHVLGQGDGEDLITALALADAAIERSEMPTPYHHDTRGRIRYKLQKWLDAVSDLQIAIREPELAHNAHLLLADCYLHLGLSDLEQIHNSAAEQTMPIKAEQ
jgi:tetratricopeptide (TPR) repeat protein